MTETKSCPNCGQNPGDGAPAGLCPRCLLAVGLEHSPEAGIANTAALAAKAPPPAIETVRYFGDYELLEEIARGGMGVVYKGRQTSLNRIVAVKLILGEDLASQQEIERFHNEAQAAASLRHRNIVAIHEVGRHEDRYYFSMDYVDGPNLAEMIRSGPLPAGRAAMYMKTIAEAVHYAHQQGILHRDLKPANILIDSADQPLITDFGLARRVTGERGLTVTGAVLGTPGYLSPEQASGTTEQVGIPSDVYSLGAILYELLAGRPPFYAASVALTLQQVRENPPLALRQLNSDVPQDLETICLKCLEKSPDIRYPSAAELAADLGRFLEHQPIEAAPAGKLRKLDTWIRRRPWTLAGIASFVVLLLLMLLYYQLQQILLLQHRQSHPEYVRGTAPRGGGPEAWFSVAGVGFLVVITAIHAFLFRSFRVTSWQDFQDSMMNRLDPHPVGPVMRIVCAVAGMSVFVFGIVLTAMWIETCVWEGSIPVFLLWLALGLVWFSLWLLILLVRDYRLEVYGRPLRPPLDPTQAGQIRRALGDKDPHEAIRLYREMVPDADRVEAGRFIQKLAGKITSGNPASLIRPQINWRSAGICLVVEVIVLVILWQLDRPLYPALTLLEFSGGTLVGMAFLMFEFSPKNKRAFVVCTLLAYVGLFGTLIAGDLFFEAAVAERRSSPLGRDFGIPYFAGMLCAVLLARFAFGPSRRRTRLQSGRGIPAKSRGIPAKSREIPAEKGE